MKPASLCKCSNTIILCMLLIVLINMACSEVQESLPEILYLETTMIIDSSSDLEHIFTAVDAVVDSHGKIFILDHVRMVILAFSKEGEFLYEFGGQGEGPGEFSSLYLNFDLDDSGLVYTINNCNSISIFNNDGSYRCEIDASVGQIFDIAAVDSGRIYVNAFPGVVQLFNTSSIPAVLLLDANGDVIREVGHLETDLENIGQKKMHFSCAIDTDENNSIYYASLADYHVAKYDSSGTFVWSVTGPSSFSAYSVQHELGSSLHPVVWDLDVDQGRVFVLWAQGGDHRGYRVDVFDAYDGEFTGCFYSQTPSDEKNMFIGIDGDDFYTLDFDYGVIYKYKMYPI
ncbi:MAG: 6-bladed beta-propeller [Candidatus Sabulitectum sp.]|nr:6-bladed beta-propeller [Candidatus Sabulitectum sp.]